MKNPTQTKVNTRTTYDSMSITVKYPSGGQLKYKINRSGEVLSVAFSSDTNELRTQAETVKTWIASLTGNNQEKMDAIKAHFEKFTSGRDAVNALRTQTATK